jgi:hypothetical protein
MAEKKAAKKATKTANPAAKKAAARLGPRADKADGEAAVLAKIAAMPVPYRAMGEGLHALISRSSPALQPTVDHLIESAWYFTALDDATEAKLSVIVRKVAS